MVRNFVPIPVVAVIRVLVHRKYSGHFEIQEVHRVRSKPSLLICTKILLQYFYDIPNRKKWVDSKSWQTKQSLQMATNWILTWCKWRWLFGDGVAASDKGDISLANYQR